VIVFAFAGDSTMTRRVPSLIGGIAAPRPPVVRREVPPLTARVVVRRVVVVAFVPFVAFAVVRVVVRFVCVFVALVVSAALVRRVPLARVVVFDSSGIAPLLSVRS
jgi:hypothetical protein